MRNRLLIVTVCWLLLAPGPLFPADGTVATVVHARTGNGYKRESSRDGSFKPEYYALTNGGRVKGTTGDVTVDRVTYEQVAGIAMRLLGQQNYHYAQKKEQAKLLLVLQWGNTIAPNGINKSMNVAAAGIALETLKLMQRELGVPDTVVAGMGSSAPFGGNEAAAVGYAAELFESQMAHLLADNRMRDEVNGYNARLLGYSAEIQESDDIRRWAGGGDRFKDLLGDVEETRYYIIITAYDFQELLKHQKQKQLWITRVSVRSPGNSFEDSYLAMMKSASHYFGQDSGKLIRQEESKGSVELGDLKFLGEAKEAEKSPAKPKQ